MQSPDNDFNTKANLISDWFFLFLEKG